MRRHLVLIAIIALVAAACSTGGGDAATSSTTTSLVVTTTSTTPPTTSVVTAGTTTQSIVLWVPGDAAAVIRPAVTAFEADTGIGVEVTTVEMDVALDLILAEPENAPDVVIGPHAWLTALTSSGFAEPITPRSGVVAGALAAVTLRGIVHAAPLAVDTVVEFRNTDELPAAPTTVESLAAGCPDADDTPQPCLLLSEASVDGHYPFISGAGGYVFGPDEYDGWDAETVGLDTAEGLAGGLILEAIVDGAGILGDGSTSVEERFADGDAPMLWGTASTLERLRGLGARFTVENLPSIAELPAVPPLRVVAAWVNAFSSGKDAARTFVEDYLTDPGVADEVALSLGLAPVDVAFDADADLVPFVLAARSGEPVPTIYEAAFAWEQLATAFADIRDGDDAAEALMSAAVALRNAPPPPEPEPAEEG